MTASLYSGNVSSFFKIVISISLSFQMLKLIKKLFKILPSLFLWPAVVRSEERLAWEDVGWEESSWDWSLLTTTSSSTSSFWHHPEHHTVLPADAAPQYYYALISLTDVIRLILISDLVSEQLHCKQQSVLSLGKTSHRPLFILEFLFF